MRYILLFFVIFLLPLSLQSKENMADSLKTLFIHAQTQQERMERCLNLDNYYRNYLLKDSIPLTRILFDEGVKAKNEYIIADALRKLIMNINRKERVLTNDSVIYYLKLADRKSDMAVSSGKLEIAAPVSGGYMEITFADSRARKDTWQHYRNAMVEHLQAALMDRDRIRQLEKVRPAAALQSNRQDEAVRLADVCRSFIEHMVQALEAGYSMGRSVRYLKNSLMLPLMEAALKCSEHGPVKPSDMLSVYSGCVCLGYEKVNMNRFCEKLVGNGVRDYVYDSLVRCIVPEWELSEGSVFPEIKEWLVSHHGTEDGAEAETALKEISCISGNALICDALMKTVQNGKR